MIYLYLFWEFFKIGLMAIGGGMVTIPFLMELAEKSKWYSQTDLLNMIAVAESTPGPIGVNMATYVGYSTSGVGGGIVATLGLVLPSIIIITIIAKYLFSNNTNCFMQRLLFGVRPAVLALILYAGWEVAKISLVDYKAIGFALIIFGLMRWIKIHPIVYIAVGAIIGIVLKL